MYTFLLATALVFSAPLILLVLAGRRRLPPQLSRSLIAAGFGAATAYMLWRMEWYDVWRHGIPPANLLLIYAVYIAGFAAVGWFLGTRIAPKRAIDR
jgi:hypothetical protein